MFIRPGKLNEYTLLQQHPSSPGICPDSPTPKKTFSSRGKPGRERLQTTCKTRKFVWLISIFTAALVLIIYLTIPFLLPDSKFISGAWKLSQASQLPTSIPSSSPNNSNPFLTPLQRPTGQTPTFTASSQATPLVGETNLIYPELSSFSQSSSAELASSSASAIPPNPLQSDLHSPPLPGSSLKVSPLSEPGVPPKPTVKTPKTPENSSAPSNHSATLKISQSNHISAPTSSPNKTLCAQCRCSEKGVVSPTFNSPHLSRPTFLDSSRLGPSPQLPQSPQTKMMGQIWASIRDVYCQHPLLSSDSALRLLENTQVDSPNLSTRLQWNLTSIAPAIPTLYLFTKTSRLGRTSALRPDYFRRHTKTINKHLSRIRERGGKYFPETVPEWGSGPRQLIWILVEDGEEIAPDVEGVIRQSWIPFIYVAYGSTNRYGNAQQNAAYAIIHRLSHSVLGHGPIVSIDDDGNFLPDLLDLAWRVKRLGVWPMGNLGPTGWEGPKYDTTTHAFLGWQRSPTDNRRFPVDNGAFVFSTKVFGTGRMIGPRYWPTDYPGGESEFVSLIVSKIEEIEPLCYNCHVAWHNQPLSRECIDHSPNCREFDVPKVSSSA